MIVKTCRVPFVSACSTTYLHMYLPSSSDRQVPPFRQPPQSSDDFAVIPLPDPARPATPSTGELADCCWSRGMFTDAVGSAGDGFVG